jgi:hypothetical protein
MYSIGEVLFIVTVPVQRNQYGRIPGKFPVILYQPERDHVIIMMIALVLVDSTFCALGIE